MINSETVKSSVHKKESLINWYVMFLNDRPTMY